MAGVRHEIKHIRDTAIGYYDGELEPEDEGKAGVVRQV